LPRRRDVYLMDEWTVWDSVHSSKPLTFYQPYKNLAAKYKQWSVHFLKPKQHRLHKYVVYTEAPRSFQLYQTVYTDQ